MDWVVPGAVLAGKYTLERKLGQGGMGAVWRAEHRELRSPVAIKVIDEQIAGSADALARFMREAQSAAALRSPHVVQILDYGSDRGVPFIAMELLEGESLATRLERVGRLPPAEVARIITEVARAIGKAHELAIVHRDLKPDNIYLVHNDETEVTKVLDFGIAKATLGLGVVSGSETRTGAILGTPHYMSPEQAEGTKLVDHRTDLWALGVIAFECLVGRRPFDSDALGSLLLAICTRPIPVPSAYGCLLPGFDAWFARACARELGERFQSARELATELRRIAGGEGRDSAVVDDSRGAFSATAPMLTPFVAVPPTGSGAATAPPARSKAPALAVVLGGVVAVALVGAGVALVTHKAPAEPAAEPLHAAPSVLPSAVTPELAPLPSAAPSAPNVTPGAALTTTATAPSAAKLAAPARPRPAARKAEKPAPAAPSAPPPSNKVNLGI
jgi:serine/threonine-protein kinase